MKSVSTRKGIIQSIYRWIYANGWSASGASVFVSCLAFPLSPIPSTVMIGLGVALAALRLGVDYIEQILVMLEEDRSMDERLRALRGATQDDSNEIEHVRVHGTGNDLEDWTYGLGKYSEPVDEVD